MLDNISVEEGNQSPFSWFVMDGDYESEWSELYASEGIRSLELKFDDISLKVF